MPLSEKSKMKAAKQGKKKQTSVKKKPVQVVVSAKTAGKVFNPSKAPTVRRTAPSPEVKKALVEQVCAVTDPFCAGAYNSRLPDGSGAQTLTTQVHQLLSIGCAASGGFALGVFTPSGYNLTNSATNPLTIGALANYTATAAGSTYANNSATARIVSFGVIVRTSANSTNAQGNLIIGEAQNVTSGTTSFTIGDFLLRKPHVVEITGGMELCWKASPINSVLAKEFLSSTLAGGAATGSDALGWPTIVVQVTGGPASTVALITVEAFVNLEWTLPAENTMIPMLPPPKAPNNTVVKLADKVNADTGGAHDVGPDLFAGVLGKAASSAASMLADVDWAEFLMGVMMLF
jgi:hypothetical protein